MNKHLILTLLLALSFSPAMAQKYIVKRSSASSKTMQTQKKPAYIKGKTQQSSATEQAAEKITSFFHRWDYTYDAAGIVQQLKGYEWVMTNKHEKKNRFLPRGGRLRLLPFTPTIPS